MIPFFYVISINFLLNNLHKLLTLGQWQSSMYHITIGIYQTKHWETRYTIIFYKLRTKPFIHNNLNAQHFFLLDKSFPLFFEILRITRNSNNLNTQFFQLWFQLSQIGHLKYTNTTIDIPHVKQNKIPSKI